MPGIHCLCMRLFAMVSWGHVYVLYWRRHKLATLMLQLAHSVRVSFILCCSMPSGCWPGAGYIEIRLKKEQGASDECFY